MADITTGIRSHLVANAGVTALVADRVFPQFQSADDAGATPYVTTQVVGINPTNDLDGEDALQNTRVQITAWSDSKFNAIAVRDAVKTALVGQHAPFGPVARASARRVSEIDVYDDKAQLVGIATDYSLWHT